jgi:hypothetical protein
MAFGTGNATRNAAAAVRLPLKMLGVRSDDPVADGLRAVVVVVLTALVVGAIVWLALFLPPGP